MSIWNGSALVLLAVVCTLVDVGGARSCYNCADCTDNGSAVDCTILSNSPYCYMTIDSHGEIARSCGIEQLDKFNFPLGCTTEGENTICKCDSDFCNLHPEAIAITTTPMLTQEQTTNSTDTNTTSGSVDVGSSRSCYNCVDCKDNGEALDCSIISNSPYCYMAIQTDGSVSRSCGIDEIDAYNIPLGCLTADDTTICKCDTDLCNVYPEINETTTVVVWTQEQTNTTYSPVAETTTPLVDIGGGRTCYNCAECRDNGDVIDCSIFSDSPYCYMAIDADGSIARSCGIEQLDAFNFTLGCTTEGGNTICKCDTDLCNAYPEAGVTTTAEMTPPTTTTTAPVTPPCKRKLLCRLFGNHRDNSWRGSRTTTPAISDNTQNWPKARYYRKMISQLFRTANLHHA